MGEDFYAIPTSVDLNSNQATIEIIIHPLINWLWLGGVVLLLGILLALWSERRAFVAPRLVRPARPAPLTLSVVMANSSP